MVNLKAYHSDQILGPILGLEACNRHIQRLLARSLAVVRSCVAFAYATWHEVLLKQQGRVLLKSHWFER